MHAYAVPSSQEAMKELEKVTKMDSLRGGEVPAFAIQKDGEQSLDSSV